MNIGSIVALIIFIILFIIFIVWIFRKDKEISGYRVANERATATIASLESGDGSNLGFSIWVYVSEWSNEEKHIFTIGAAESGDQLIFKLGDTIPSLLVTTQRNGIETVPFNPIMVNNLPLQTWVCVAVSFYNSSMDIYINGKLVKTRVSKSNDYLSLAAGYDGDVPIILFDNDEGFSGYINKFNYWNKALTPQEAWNIYKSGPGGTMFGNLISGRSININLMNGNDVTSSFNI
tara:strand:+ start:542 stop:1243 length:702 start_codon:yes stop_codon:yes gene_type:complete